MLSLPAQLGNALEELLGAERWCYGGDRLAFLRLCLWPCCCPRRRGGGGGGGVGGQLRVSGPPSSMLPPCAGRVLVLALLLIRRRLRCRRRWSLLFPFRLCRG